MLAARARARGELACVHPRGACGLAGLLDPALDVGLELLAEQREQDVFLGAAGEVCRRVDGEALEQASVLGCELLERADVLLEDGDRGLEGVAGGDASVDARSVGKQAGEKMGFTNREGSGLELRTDCRRLWILLVSWEKRLRNSSNCFSSSGAMLSDAMVASLVGSFGGAGFGGN